MPKFTVNQIIDYVEKWVVTGELNVEMLADNFHFISHHFIFCRIQ